jgi:hypothetical protein
MHPGSLFLGFALFEFSYLSNTNDSETVLSLIQVSGLPFFAMILKLSKTSPVHYRSTKIRRLPFLIFWLKEEKEELFFSENGGFVRKPLQLLC